MKKQKMIYVFILLYSCTACFVQTSKIHDDMTDNEIWNMFGTPRDGVPDYDIVSMHSITKRSLGELSIKIKSTKSNTVKELHLSSAKEYFAGDETKIWIAERINSKDDKLKYTLQENVMKTLSKSFYEDKNTHSSVFHRINKRGFSEFYGVIDSNNVIRPLPKSIRKRRDISSKLSLEYGLENTDNYHIIHKRADKSGEKSSIPWRVQVSKTKSKLGKPAIVYPETLIFADKTLFSFFENNVIETVAYLLTFWNAVDLRYREMKDPKVRFYIAGIVLLKDDIGLSKKQPFTINTEILKKFGQFLYKEDKFKLRVDYDIAILLGGHKIPKHLEVSKDKRLAQTETMGKAFSVGACSNYNDRKEVRSAAIILDDGGFYGVQTAAHEIGHLFGVPHDGGELDMADGPGAENCPPEDGYIMTANKGNLVNSNQFYFSSCSLKIMSHFFSLQTAECLRNNPADRRKDKQILRILPGKYMTPDEQCKMKGYLGVAKIDHTTCLNLMCISREYKQLGKMKVPVQVRHILKTGASEGSSCGFDMHCIRGECVTILPEKNQDNNDLIKRIFAPFDPLYLTALYKVTNDQCIKRGIRNVYKSTLVNCRLFCAKPNPSGEIEITNVGVADDGSWCKTYDKEEGYCKSGKCEPDVTGITGDKRPSSMKPEEKRFIETLSKECGKNKLGPALNTLDCTAFCSKPPDYIDFSITKAKDGVRCNNEAGAGVCMSGFCETEALKDTIYKNFKSKTAEEQCKERKVKNLLKSAAVDCVLYCISDNVLGNSKNKLATGMFEAAGGTSCGLNGFCRKGKCLERAIKTNHGAATSKTTKITEIDKLADKLCKKAGSVSKVVTFGCLIVCTNNKGVKSQIKYVEGGKDFPCK